MITGYHLRQRDGKRQTVKALKSLNYEVYAFGDSYNDITMLQEADHGILYRPPRNVKEDYPEFPLINDYPELKSFLEERL